MPLDVARLRDSDMASEQTPEENWAAVLLWAAAWHQVPAGSMPDSDNWIAKAAGYLSRGRIDPHWKDVRAGAMRGFVLCSDGRWYHPVVAEKANESWIGKLKQRLKTECARIKKHNDRHGTRIPFPEFDAWFAAGCPVGQPLPVPKDITPKSQGTGEGVTGDNIPLSLKELPEVPSETPSKGQGEGQRQGELTTKALSGGAYGSSRENLHEAPLPPREDPEPNNNPAIALTVTLRKWGVNATFTHPAVQDWSKRDEVTHDILAAAVAIARERLGDSAKIAPNYLVNIVEDLLNPPAKTEAAPQKPKSDSWAWKRTDKGCNDEGAKYGLRARGGESRDEFIARIEAAKEKRKGQP
jgi:hypothetical protein